MKWALPYVPILFAYFSAHSQNNFPLTGNVGINLEGSTASNKLQIGSNPQGWSGNDLVVTNANGGLAFFTESDHSYIYGSKSIAIRPGLGLMSIYARQNGKVGIGHATPQKNLDVNAGVNDYISIGQTLGIGQWSGLHFGYKEDQNTAYRKSALVFERVDNAANGKIHFLNNNNGSQSASLADARFTIDQFGNVGIGNTSPEGKLHVRGSAYFGNENGSALHRVAIGSSGGNYGSIGYGYKYTNNNFQHTYSVPDYASQLGFDEGGFTFRTAPLGSAGAAVSFTDIIRINRFGNIGVGSQVPQERIHIEGNGRVNIRVGRWASLGETHSGLATIIGTNVKASNAAVHRMEFIESTGDGGKAIKMQYNEGITFHTYLGSVSAGAEFSGYERMRIDNSGNVSIGTTNPQGYRLAVAGKAVAEEIVVKLQGSWPDYVFDDDHALPSLSEVEKFIKENKHLPDVPSESHVKENGIPVGEMNAILLKKIEELTLHLIQQQKVIEQQQQTIKEYGSRLERLEQK
jgi:hypothetical protein